MDNTGLLNNCMDGLEVIFAPQLALPVDGVSSILDVFHCRHDVYGNLVSSD